MSASTPFGLYVHWPYCQRLCPYCDFNIYRQRDGEHDDLLQAILADIKAHGERIGVPGLLHSLSFGGGTPSLMKPHQIRAVIETAAKVFGFDENVEISLEANPDALDDEICQNFANAGINRLSIGVQSLDDTALKFLGRDHSAAQAQKAVRAAQKAGLRVSADFIYDLPGQSIEEWTRGLSAALALNLAHYSFYALTIEPGTAFGVQVQKGRLNPSTENHAFDLYALTQDITAKAGLPAYEVSNHARSPDDQSRHNLIYWQNGDWVGVGPGAHGRVNFNGQRTAMVSAMRPDAYCNQVKGTGWGINEITPLTREDITMEALSMGLRLRTGLDLYGLKTRTGHVINQTKLQSLIDEGFLQLHNTRLSVREKGWAVIDRLVLELLT